MIDAAAEMTASQSAERFAADQRTRLAVERCIEIVSEASRRISAADKARTPHVPWPRIAAMGNILRHEYHRTSPSVVWHTATQSLPELRPIIAALLEQVNEA
ncbi:DUF86 domain-containing protein [Enterovirga sp. CN4-39]|uniref:HepT-like ribonuclease domain-containing protein n=1 Tax=Enterovirga sp. CN4-39 TaxID=3400910 RepID=UPI003C11E3A5